MSHSRVLLVVVADPALQLLVLPRHELLAGQVGVVGVVLRRVVAALGCNMNTHLIVNFKLKPLYN